MSFTRTFQIGCPGTGTRSLAAAVKLMWPELRVSHGIGVNHKQRKIRQYVNAMLDGHGCVKWFGEVDFIGELAAELWQSIYRDWPGARFILCERPVESWMAQVERRDSNQRVRRIKRRFPWDSVYGLARLKLYGSIRPGPHWATAYERHNQDVKAFFRDHSDFLVFNVWEGDGWEKLSEFLELPIPDEPFPRIRTAGRGR